MRQVLACVVARAGDGRRWLPRSYFNNNRVYYTRGEHMKIKVVLEPSEEGGYTAIIPSLLVVSARVTLRKKR